MNIVIVVTFFGGSIAMYSFVMWFHIRKLKAGVKHWSPNKGLTFVLGLGRDQPFCPFGAERRADLKVRMAAPGETVSEEDIDLFLRLYGQAFLWLLAGEAVVFGIVILMTALTKGP